MFLTAHFLLSRRKLQNRSCDHLKRRKLSNPKQSGQVLSCTLVLQNSKAPSGTKGGDEVVCAACEEEEDHGQKPIQCSGSCQLYYHPKCADIDVEKQTNFTCRICQAQNWECFACHNNEQTTDNPIIKCGDSSCGRRYHKYYHLFLEKYLPFYLGDAFFLINFLLVQIKRTQNALIIPAIHVPQSHQQKIQRTIKQPTNARYV